MIQSYIKSIKSSVRRLSIKEEGNALFLILIAVTLFAALSYAVTQSNRSAGGDAGGEKALVSGSTITQYPAGIRTGLTRMLIKGRTVDDMVFNKPGSFGGDTEVEVFHPAGGGVAYQEPGPDVTTNDTNELVFRKDVSITNIGSAADDVVAILQDVPLGVCRKINESLHGSQAIPATTETMAAVVAGGAINGTDIDGRPFLCVQDSSSNRFYYHVLVEQ